MNATWCNRPSKKTARKMLADGLDVTLVAEYAGLAAEDIAALARGEVAQA